MKLPRGFSTRRLLRPGAPGMLACYLLLNLSASVVLAGPQGAQIVNGQVSFQQSGYNTAITASDQAIINYSRFDITQPEIVQFIQPGVSASVLNRILSADPTRIDGMLLANGNVFFVNPSGVVIGNGATINVNQLVASGLNISNESFLSGQYEFSGGNGAVANYGEVSAQSVYLIGKQVTNAGMISCPKGYVVMAAGDRVLLGQPGSNVIVEMDPVPSVDQLDTGLPDAATVTNEGTVDAGGGTVVLAAAGDIMAPAVIENLGTLSASSSETDAGDIILEASKGYIENTGSIAAKSGAGVGGTVTADAADIVSSGTVDVSGTQGGTVTLAATGRLGQFGTVNADGLEGRGGQITLVGEDGVVLGATSLTTANAGVHGSGGEVIAYSPDVALFLPGASVEAKGGSQSGNGGFFELSGQQYVEVEGQIDLTAANGETGTFLIDPRDIDILDVDGPGDEPPSWGWGDWTQDPATGEWTFVPGDNSKLRMLQLEYFLDQSHITITTTAPDNDPGNVIFYDRPINSGLDPANPSNNSLTILADNDIIINPESGINFTGTGSLGLFADNNVDINGDISLAGGDFTSSGIEFDSTGAAITTAGGSVYVDHSGAVRFGNVIDTTDPLNSLSAGDVTITARLLETPTTGGDGVADIIGSTVSLTMLAGGIDPIDITALSELNADTTAEGGNITVNSIGDLPVGLISADNGAGTIGDVTLNSTGNIAATDGSDGVADVLGNTVSLTAQAGGIGPVEIQSGAATLNADTSADSSDIDIDSIGSVVVGWITTGGQGDVYLDAIDGSITAAAGADGTADIVGNMVALTAGGAVTDVIGPIETDITSIQAHAGGGIDISELDTLTADGIDLTDVDTTDGPITVTSAGTLTATDVTAGGNGDVSLTTTAGDVRATAVEALGNQIGITSAGDILVDAPGVGLRADSLDLDAAGTIGTDLASIQTSSTTISADAGQSIDIDNTSSSSTAFSGSTTGAGDILFSQTGGGALTVGTTTTLNGSIGIDVAGAELTATGAIAAGGGDVTLDADVIRLHDNVTAAGGNVDFLAAVIAEGTTDQTFGAGGILQAHDTITKSTPAAGGLTLSGAVVDLDGAVAVSTGLLTITDQAYIADD
ncbi:MAG: two-partner secretion domain-containing protein, partial [Planctomycetota bacterium]